MFDTFAEWVSSSYDKIIRDGIEMDNTYCFKMKKSELFDNFNKLAANISTINKNLKVIVADCEENNDKNVLVIRDIDEKYYILARSYTAVNDCSYVDIYTVTDIDELYESLDAETDEDDDE